MLYRDEREKIKEEQKTNKKLYKQSTEIPWQKRKKLVPKVAVGKLFPSSSSP